MNDNWFYLIAGALLGIGILLLSARGCMEMVFPGYYGCYWKLW